MLTSRGWWLLFFSFLMLVFGLLLPLPVLAVLGFAILIWFLWQWLVFLLRRHFVFPHLRVERTLHDERGPITRLWAGRVFRVTTRLRLPPRLHLPLLLAVERLPFAADVVDGDVSAEGAVGDAAPLEVTYRLRCAKVGVARFEGVRVHFADNQGFFYHVAFLPQVALVPVLPIVHDVDGMTAVSKQRNQLLPPGVHRLRAGGAGSELLDLRDYLTGDPPKTIAWKVSARRDRLITKVFENEVPIRCTLFVDASPSVRVPTREGTAMQRLIEIAGAVMRANVHVRDLTGLCVFDDRGIAQYAPPHRKPSQFSRMLQMLADAAARLPTTSRADPMTLVPLAYSFVSEVYPEAFANDVNAVPWWLAWVVDLGRYSQRSSFLTRWLQKPIVRFGVLAMPVIGWLVYLIIQINLSVQRRRFRWRKRLAAFLSVHYGLAPGGLAALMEDDEAFSLLVQRLLAEHQVPHNLPMYDRDGRYLFASPGKVPALATALRRALSHDIDNELFVLLVDLLELDESLDPLLRTVKVALTRHHQVLVVCPWPPGIPLPVYDAADVDQPPPNTLAGILRRSTRRRFHAAYFRIRRAFGRLGVPVVCAASDEAVPLILERIDRLRTLRRTPR
jgi:uncharacterized protein (DUF58 family)